MQLSLRTFNDLVQNMAAAVQAAATQLLDLTVGSTLRAVLEANASVALWMQWLLLQVLRTTRAATSTGADLDSWMADLSLTRLPAVAATGVVTFSRFTPGIAALIPAGTLVRTADGTQTFEVAIDTANTLWAPSSNGYVVALGVMAVNIPITALIAGGAGNVQANTISRLASALPGIDAVTNGNPLQNGIDAETDEAFRGRFCNFVGSRSRATPLAVGYAIASIQQGLGYTIQENVDLAGQPRMGSFVVTVDDGTGFPSSTLLLTVQAAVDAVRPVGSVFSVRAPSVTMTNVSLTIGVSVGTSRPQVLAAVGDAIRAYINSLSIGVALPVTRVAQIAYSAHPSVLNVGQILVNGGTSDVTPPAAGVLKASTIAVN